MSEMDQKCEQELTSKGQNVLKGGVRTGKIVDASAVATLLGAVPVGGQ